MRAGAWLLIPCLAAVGCGAAPPHCTITGFNLGAQPAPGATTTPDHTVSPPGNQEQFYAIAQQTFTGPCAVPASLGPSPANWTVSDTVHVAISSARDQTNGVATCLGATSAPATVTATVKIDGFTKSATSTISCK